MKNLIETKMQGAAIARIIEYCRGPQLEPSRDQQLYDAVYKEHRNFLTGSVEKAVMAGHKAVIERIFEEEL